MKKEHQAKAQKARQEARPKKLFVVCGYEVRVDPLNYIIVKDNNYSYFSTIENALKDIVSEMIRENLKNTKNLEDVIFAVETAHKTFFDRMIQIISTFPPTFQPPQQE